MCERANELLAEREQPLIGNMTPHTLRRTFAVILAEVGMPPRPAMYLLGHTDPTLTMRVYQQVLDMGGAAVEQLEGVLGCTIQEAFVTYCDREGLGTQWTPGLEIASQNRGHRFRLDAVGDASQLLPRNRGGFRTETGLRGRVDSADDFADERPASALVKRSVSLGPRRAAATRVCGGAGGSQSVPVHRLTTPVTPASVAEL